MLSHQFSSLLKTGKSEKLKSGPGMKNERKINDKLVP